MPPIVLAARIADRFKVPALTLLVVVLLLVAARGWLGSRDPNQGLATTCRHFLEMTHDAQAAVMHKGGVVPAVVEQRIQYFKDQCLAHPEGLDHAISDLW